LGRVRRQRMVLYQIGKTQIRISGKLIVNTII
jgi:hypothetical protein